MKMKLSAGQKFALFTSLTFLSLSLSLTMSPNFAFDWTTAKHNPVVLLFSAVTVICWVLMAWYGVQAGRENSDEKWDEFDRYFKEHDKNAK